MTDGTEVQVVQEAALATDQDWGDLTFAQRVALDPTVDIARLEKVIEMEVASQDREAEKIFNRALSEMQPQLPAIDRGAESHTGWYAKLENIQSAIRPTLAEYGFAVRFKVHDRDNGLAVECILSHRDGHSDSDMITLPFEDSGSKNDVQARGSTVSYGKRYTLCNILNIQVGGMDNDGAGNLPQALPTISESQENELHALLTDNDRDVAKFCAFANIGKIGDIQANNFEQAKQQILAVIANKKERQS